MSLAWALRPGNTLAFRQWDDATFVFDAFSGRTHYLNGAAAEMLALLSEAPLPISDTDARLLEEFAPEDPAAFLEAATRVLELLEQLALVTRGA